MKLENIFRAVVISWMILLTANYSFAKAVNATDTKITSNIKDVDSSNSTVKESEHPFDDSLITAKVKGKFIQQKLFGSRDIAAITIEVETNNGVVALTGTADNQNQVNNAINIAKTVGGVKSVENMVHIKQ